MRPQDFYSRIDPIVDWVMGRKELKKYYRDSDKGVVSL